jgi:dTDP-6-deoxy-L-talose 4-dehydrogenase (NAD+)
MKPTILLTGASGFVGRQLWKVLHQRAVTVVPVVRTGKADSFGAEPPPSSVVTTSDLFCEGDDWLRRACSGVDTIIHAAWYVEPGKYLLAPQNLDCLVGTLRLARAAAQAGVRRFVGIGTCFEYGFSAEPLSTQTCLRPSTPYAAAKAAAFMSLSQWLPTNNVEFAWCRLFYCYGEEKNPKRLFPYVRSRLAAGLPAELSNGDKVRDYIDVRQAAEMIADVALGGGVGAFNICSGKGRTLREIVEQIADEYDARSLLRFGARLDQVAEPLSIIGVPGQSAE